MKKAEFPGTKAAAGFALFDLTGRRLQEAISKQISNTNHPSVYAALADGDHSGRKGQPVLIVR